MTKITTSNVLKLSKNNKTIEPQLLPVIVRPYLKATNSWIYGRVNVELVNMNLANSLLSNEQLSLTFFKSIPIDQLKMLW
jgi:hypothetical protein